MSARWFRLWFAAARLLGMRPWVALRFVGRLDAASVPARNFAYFVCRPVLWWRVQHYRRLLRAGLDEVAL